MIDRSSSGASRIALTPLLAAAALCLGACGIPGLPRLPDPGRPAAGDRDVAAHPAVGHAGAPLRPDDARDCFARHLREAITLNRRRAPVYAAWSGGASSPVSRRLIRTERAALAAAWYVDRRARRFQRAGIPIGCAEFVSMAMTPALPSERPSAPAGPYQPRPGAESLRDSLVAAYGQGGFPAVERLADRRIRELNEEPRYHCMTRHLLESIRRVAHLAPVHAADAERKGLRGVGPLSELLLRLHLAALPGGADLDREAGPVQQEGVPILCRDVPPIP